MSSEKAYARQAVGKHIRTIRRSWVDTYEGRGTEPLHRMRVELRRLENTLVIFKEIFPAKDFKRWRRQMSPILGSLGRARDGDIYLLFLSNERRRIRRAEAKKAFLDLTAAFVQRRRAEQPSLVKAMDTFHKRKVLEQLDNAIPAPKSRGNVDGRKLKKLADRAVRRRLRKFLSYEPYIMQPAKIKELHRMRVAAKKLRYTLETFDKVYGRQVTPYVNAVKALQGYLGKMHDYDGLLMALTDIFSITKKRQARQTATMCSRTSASIAYTGDHLQTLYGRVYDEFLRAWLRYSEKDLWARLVSDLRIDKGYGRSRDVQRSPTRAGS